MQGRQAPPSTWGKNIQNCSIYFPGVCPENLTRLRIRAGETHHLNIPKICGLRAEQVIYRGEILHALEPNAKRKQEQWWDPVHFHAQVCPGALLQLGTLR